MFKLYILPGIKQLKKHKTSCVINILSFSLAIGILLVVGLFLKHEFTYDNFQIKKNKIYRLEINDWASLPPGIKEIIKDENSIKKFTRLSFVDDYEIYTLNSTNDKDFYSFKEVVWADTSIFDIFTFDFINGSILPNTIAPNDIILSESTAKRIFNDRNPINKILYYRNGIPFNVIGVFKDFKHSHLQFDAICSMEYIELQNGEEWMRMIEDDWAYPYYLLLNKNQNPQTAIKNIKSIIRSREIWEEVNINLTPITELYLNDNVGIGKGYHKSGDIKLMYILISIGLFILLIAIVNYINLSTASIKLRVPEIFIKKTIGAKRIQIFIQFISETTIILLIALFIGYLIAESIIPIFNNIFHTELQMTDYYSAPIIFLLILISILIGAISGIYPALFLSGLNPIEIKNDFNAGNSRSAILRKTLSIFQFCLTSFLIIVSIFINKQIVHLKACDVGFNKTNVITMKLNHEIIRSKDVFREKVLQLHDVSGFSYSCRTPGEHQWVWGVTINNKQETIHVNAIDPDFINLYDLKILEGRNFDWNRPADMDNLFILNEAAKKLYELDQVTGIHVSDAANGPGQIIGLIKDFHFLSTKTAVEPTLYYWLNWPHGSISIQFSDSNYQKAISDIKNIWEELVDYNLFEFEILEDTYNDQYQNEEILVRYFIYLSLVAIFIAIMGLYAMTKFISDNRTKEIGIRKALGATTFEILSMLLKEISTWLLIAFLISIPISIWFLKTWLQNFANKAIINWQVFIPAGVILFLVAIATIYFQIMKLSKTNPVYSLRYE